MIVPMASCKYVYSCGGAKPSPGVPKNVPALRFSRDNEASTAHHGISAAAEREVGKVFLLAAHVEADRDDEDEIKKENCRIDREPCVHVRS